MKDRTREKFYHWFTFGLLAVIVIGGGFMAWPNYRNSRALLRKDAALKEDIKVQKEAIARILEKQRRFRDDPDFVEKIARENRRVFPGELVFIFED